MAEKINFFIEETSFIIQKKVLLRKWIQDSILKERAKTGNINIILCNDEYLHDINLKYLKHDTFTDIITFNYSESDTISGDLFISIDRVLENAGMFSKTNAEELHRVIIHGILHLCNYDDKTISEKEKMTQKEDIYLAYRPEQLKVL